MIWVSHWGNQCLQQVVWMNFDCLTSARCLYLLHFALRHRLKKSSACKRALQSRWGAEKNCIFLFTSFVTAQSFKGAAVCSLISETVSLLFKKQRKSVSRSMYVKITTSFKLFTLEMWLLKRANIRFFRLQLTSPVNVLTACSMVAWNYWIVEALRKNAKIPAWYLTFEVVIFLKL